MKKIVITILSVFSLALCFASTKVYAEALSHQTFTINDADLYNKTNTYEYNANYNANESRYYMNVKTGEVDQEQVPLLTVLTHGLNGDASNWSNDGTKDFAYSDDSLVTRLAKLTDSNVYWVRFYDDIGFYVSNITSQVYDGIDGNFRGNYSSGATRPNINDITKHSIIVFQASPTIAKGKNDEVYTQFNYAISQIVHDIRVVNNGELPRMNLIGHSRGGITNMQYALDHPDLVDSIYSLGTPYTGSTTASLDLEWFNASLSGSKAASEDITSKAVYGKYMDRWNNGYLPGDIENDLYSHIDVMALGGYGTLLHFAEGLTTDKSLDFLTGMQFFSWASRDLLKYGIPTVLKLINYAVILQNFTTGGIGHAALRTLISRIVFELTANFDLDDNAITDALQILTNEIKLDFRPPFVAWHNDGLVDLGSQLGYEGLIPLGSNQYKGFERISKAFTESNVNFDNLSMSTLPAVAHNLEARDQELGAYILSDISMGLKINVDYETYMVDATKNEIGIGAYIGKTAATHLQIPEYINGKKVVAIGDYAFANNAYNQENLTSITIPASVKYIGKNAFYQSDQITSITFSDYSVLKTIGEGAFSMMPELSSFSIGAAVNVIGETAFAYSGITNFDIASNKNYAWQNNFLISKNVSDQSSYIAIYANPKVTEFTVPLDVKILSAGIFENNRVIERINLSEVVYVGVNAFANSTLSYVEGGYKINNLGENAFSQTPWLEEQNSDFIVIGSVLISYLGHASSVEVPEGITTIAENAFSNQETQSVILPTTVNVIGKEAFANLEHLEWILFKSTQAPVLDENAFASDVILYMKETSYNYFENSIYFKDIDNTMTTKSFNVEFRDVDGNTIGHKTEVYSSSFDQFIDAPAITGHDFMYWLDEQGNMYRPYNLLNIYHDIKLQPVYEKSRYLLKIIDGNEEGTIDIQYGDTLNLYTPQKEGYQFIGWYDRLEGGNLIVDVSDVVVWNRTSDIDYLYARYELINYQITYVGYGGEFMSDNRYQFNALNPISTTHIAEIKRFGYVLDYWTYQGDEFKSTDGIYQDITIEARWLGTLRSYMGDTYATIVDEYAIINLRNPFYTAEYVFLIAPTVKSVTFVGNQHTFTRMKITISTRSNPLVMGFESMNFHPEKSLTGQGENAVTANSEFMLYIMYKDSNSIMGGAGKDGSDRYEKPMRAMFNKAGVTGIVGGQGFNGGHGISASDIVFSEYDRNSSITVIGGAGGRGGYGGVGQQGSDGVQHPNGSWLSPKKGDDGARGGNGGAGGNGGNGGYAIKVRDNTRLKVSSDSHYQFIGGAGAKGGNGSIATNALYVYGIGGRGGAGGGRGSAGNGGLGGSAGSVGNNGNDGQNGAKGSLGSYGIQGTTGYNTTETHEGIRNIGYAFDKQFIISMI